MSTADVAAALDQFAGRTCRDCPIPELRYALELPVKIKINARDLADLLRMRRDLLNELDEDSLNVSAAVWSVMRTAGLRHITHSLAAMGIEIEGDAPPDPDFAEVEAAPAPPGELRGITRPAPAPAAMGLAAFAPKRCVFCGQTEIVGSNHLSRLDESRFYCDDCAKAADRAGSPIVPDLTGPVPVTCAHCGRPAGEQSLDCPAGAVLHRQPLAKAPPPAASAADDTPCNVCGNLWGHPSPDCVNARIHGPINTMMPEALLTSVNETAAETPLTPRPAPDDLEEDIPF